ncbi:MAG: nuclear transport factor 2 family protein [bacterium]
MVADDDFAAAVDAANRANEALLAGSSAALRACFSHGEDISLYGGFGGHEVGWAQIGPRLDWVAQSFAGGHCTYEPISRVVGGDVGLAVQFERGEAQLRGHGAAQRLNLRVSMVFRREADAWKMVHRHADPLIDKTPPT